MPEFFMPQLLIKELCIYLARRGRNSDWSTINWFIYYKSVVRGDLKINYQNSFSKSEFDKNPFSLLFKKKKLVSRRFLLMRHTTIIEKRFFLLLNLL